MLTLSWFPLSPVLFSLGPSFVGKCLPYQINLSGKTLTEEPNGVPQLCPGYIFIQSSSRLKLMILKVFISLLGVFKIYF